MNKLYRKLSVGIRLIRFPLEITLSFNCSNFPKIRLSFFDADKFNLHRLAILWDVWWASLFDDIELLKNERCLFSKNQNIMHLITNKKRRINKLFVFIFCNITIFMYCMICTILVITNKSDVPTKWTYTLTVFEKTICPTHYLYLRNNQDSTTFRIFSFTNEKVSHSTSLLGHVRLFGRPEYVPGQVN